MIQIVVVRPQHSGNVGAVARAMHVCGLDQLAIVGSPNIIDQQSYSRCVKANHVLDNTNHVETLDQALSLSQCVVVCSARLRHLNHQNISPEQLPLLVSSLPKKSKLSIVFGPERTGLETDEILMGTHLLRIPMKQANTSLNLSHAVQLISYFATSEVLENNDCNDDPLVTVSQRNHFFERVQDAMNQSSLTMKGNPEHTYNLFKSIFNRILMTTNEMNFLYALFAKKDKK